MEKYKKELKNYVLVVGGSRGEIEDVVVVECENGMEEYLKKRGEEVIGEIEDDSVVEEFGIGKVVEYDSSIVGKVCSVCLSDEDELYMFEGGEISYFEDFDSIGELIDYLEI
jgi:hypothetical protein